MRTRVIVVCVCVCVFPVCQLHWNFYSKLNTAISFSESFKDLQLTDLSKVVYFKRYYFVPTFAILSIFTLGNYYYSGVYVKHWKLQHNILCHSAHCTTRRICSLRKISQDCEEEQICHCKHSIPHLQ